MVALAVVTDVEAVSRPVPLSAIPQVTRLIEMVSATVVNETGQSFAYLEDDEVTVVPVDGVLRLPQHPVTDIASIVISGTTVDADTYRFTSNGYVTRIRTGFSQASFDIGCAWYPVDTIVTYSHGYETDYPADLSMVVAEKVAAKWLAGAREAEGLTSEQIDGYAAAYAQVTNPDKLNEHKRILDSYRRSGFASLRLG